MNKKDAVVLGASVAVLAYAVDSFRRFRKYEKNLRKKAQVEEVRQAIAGLRAVLVAQSKTLPRIREGRYKTNEDLKYDFEFELIAAHYEK